MTQMQCNMFRLSMPHLESRGIQSFTHTVRLQASQIHCTRNIFDPKVARLVRTKKTRSFIWHWSIGRKHLKVQHDKLFASMCWLGFSISGILAGGIPGFRMVLCCFPHLRVWPCVCLCSPSVFVMFMAILWWDETMLSLLAWICHELVASHSFVCWFLVLFLFCFGSFCLFVLFVCFCLSWLWMMTAYWTVQVLHQFCFVALNSRWPRVLIEITAFAMP